MSSPYEQLPVAGASAVAIVTCEDYFLLEGRPARAGMAYPGQWQVFGGHIDPSEEAYDAIRRELREELNWTPTGPLPLVFNGDVPSRNRHGDLVRRNVSLFAATALSMDELRLQVPGEIIPVHRTLEAVEAARPRLAKFAYRALKKTITGAPWELVWTEDPAY